MRVYINHTAFDIFEGAKVKDALTKFYSGKIPSSTVNLHVVDSFGNKLMMNGSLEDGDEVFVNVKTNEI
jgi:hypothetical protein